MTRFVLYCRVATQDKQEPNSEQLDRLREYIGERGWAAVPVYGSVSEPGHGAASGGEK